MFLLRRIRKRIKELFALVAAVAVAFSVGGSDSQSEPTSETKGLVLSTTGSEVTAVSVTESTAAVQENETYIILADDMTIINGEGAAFSDGVVTVKKSGTYYFKGELNDGRILVDIKGDDGEVVLKLCGVKVSSSKGAPLSVNKAPDKVVLYSEEKTVNDFSDRSERVYTYEEEIGDSAVIFSKEDIAFEGDGFLRIRADFNKGIFSIKDVTVTGARINIASFDDGIRSNETVRIKNSELVLASGGDGIHATANARGKVVIYESDFSYIGDSDGIEAAGDVLLYGGNAEFLVAGGSIGKYYHRSHGSVLDEDNAPDKNKNDILSAGKAIADSTTLEKAMGKKKENAAVSAGGEAAFNDVSLKIDSAYHGVIGQSIELENGSCSLRSDGNGFYAEDEVFVDGVRLNIGSSYNGIECKEAELCEGNIFINAFNEGIVSKDEEPRFKDVMVEIKDKSLVMPEKP